MSICNMKTVTGNKDAFEKLIVMHQEYLYKTAYMYTKNEQDALDAVQECAMRAMISMDKLQEHSKNGGLE